MHIKNIVLVHGWGSESKKLDDLRKFLHNYGWNVYNIKLPGFEDPEPKTAWNLDDYAKFVYESSKKFFRGERYYVFGHSFGGRVAIKCAFNKYPNIAGLVLCSSSGISRGNTVKRLLFKTLALVGKIVNQNNDLSLKWRKTLYFLAREHDYEKAQGIMKSIFKNIIAEDLKIIVGKIKIPVLILWGKKDKMTPFSDALFLNRNIQNSVLYTWRFEGHKLPYNKPNELAQRISKWEKSMV